MGLGLLFPLLLILNLRMNPALAGLALMPTTLPIVLVSRVSGNGSGGAARGAACCDGVRCDDLPRGCFLRLIIRMPLGSRLCSVSPKREYAHRVVPGTDGVESVVLVG
jgi:hypothetical protein